MEESNSMTPNELKTIRGSFNFTQKKMADVLGVHTNAYQRFEYGTSPIPKYIEHYALCLKALSEQKSFIKHVKLIDINKEGK